MDYSDNHDTFRNLVTQQMGYAAGRIPIYPGIGAFILTTDNTVCQIATTRELGTGGFIVFNFDKALAETYLPAIAAGATANDESDLDRDRIADAWETKFFGHIGVASASTDADGDGQSDRAEYVTGTDPTNKTDVLKLDIRSQGTSLALAFTGRAAAGAGYARIARHYRLESATNLLSGRIWSPVAGCTNRVVGSGSEEITCPITPASEASTFYRIRAWLQQTP
ncbi:MAG: hypothetical protein C0404_04435 [Verrucomicrobia bacterium]|nr:hypothetical protein [Verrucomicrobiota bacterium]